MRTDDVMRVLPKAIELLLKMGAHAGVQNKLRQTPADVIRACATDQQVATILKQTSLCCSRYISLRCPSAAVRSYGIVYKANEG